MDREQAAKEMHIVSRGDERPLRDDVRACLLLDVRDGVVEGAGNVSSLSAGGIGAACLASEGVDNTEFNEVLRLIAHGLSIVLAPVSPETK